MMTGLRKYIQYRNAGLILLGVLGTVGANIPTAAQTDKADKAAQDYKANCTLCHGDNGAGTPLGNNLKVKDLRSKEVQDMTADEMEQVIHDGKNNMPPFKARLSNDQIQGLITYIRHLGQTH